MNNVKSWKKNLKKTGALALATLVMCGSASFVRALEDEEIGRLPADSITLNGGGNEHAVYGYQTDESSGYAANITWGDMIFVYDNGTYDPETGRLIATDTLSDVQPDAQNCMNEIISSPTTNEEGQAVYQHDDGTFYYLSACTWYLDGTEIEGEVPADEDILNTVPNDDNTESVECRDGNTYTRALEFVTLENDSPVENINMKNMHAQVTTIRHKNPETAGNWYNFDGYNNSVEVQNLSTSDLKFTATPAVITANAGTSVSFSLYSDKSGLDGLTENASYLPVHGNTSASWYAGSSLTASLRAPNLDPITGEIEENGEGEIFTFYLNISGKPSSTVITESTYGGETEATTLGTITLNFSTSDDTKLSIQGNPTTGQPSEGEENGGE